MNIAAQLNVIIDDVMIVGSADLLAASTLTPRDTNLTTCIKILKAMEGYTDPNGQQLRYEARPFLINSMWYGIPQSRNRVYIVGCKLGGTSCMSMNPCEFLDRVEKYMKVLQLPLPSPETRLDV